MTRLEARRSIRKHWAEFIRNSDYPGDVTLQDPAVFAVFADETQRIASRIERSAHDLSVPPR